MLFGVVVLADDRQFRHIEALVLQRFHGGFRQSMGLVDGDYRTIPVALRNRFVRQRCLCGHGVLSFAYRVVCSVTVHAATGFSIAEQIIGQSE